MIVGSGIADTVSSNRLDDSADGLSSSQKTEHTITVFVDKNKGQ